MSNALIRLPSVKELTGLSRSSIYLFMSRGEFPEKIKLGNRAVAWLKADIDEWIEGQIKKSRVEG